MQSTDRNEAQSRELNPHQLMQRAQQEAGLTDFGDDGFVKPLTKMLECMARDVSFHAAGMQDFKNEIVRDLVNRLRFREDIKRHPEILAEDVTDPIIILGLGRSGTTKAHRMMSADPSLLKTCRWQLFNPAPFPDASAGRPDPRIAAAFSDPLVDENNMELRAAHEMAAEAPEEEWVLFEHTFNDWYQNNRNPSPLWHDWVMSRTEPSDLENYRYIYSLFQYLQWQQGGRRNRRYLMKSCGHHAHLEALTTVFPKATFMHIHRHPDACIPSAAKLIQGVWPLRIENVPPQFVGEFSLRWKKLSIDRYMRDRDRLGLSGRILDVQYEQIRENPMPVFKEIYRRAGHELTPDAEELMLAWEARNEQGKHGKHSYSLEEFGLSEEIISDAFGEYIQRYIGK